MEISIMSLKSQKSAPYFPRFNTSAFVDSNIQKTAESGVACTETANRITSKKGQVLAPRDTPKPTTPHKTTI